MLTTKGELLLRINSLKEPTTTVDLAEATSVSQQSVSRLLIDLAAEGLIIKKPLVHGLELRLTSKGLNVIASLAARLEHALGKGGRLTGKVETGIGEGKYYLSMEQYKEKLAVLLGASPYPGTLNVRVEETEKETFLARLPLFEVPGFEDGQRTYGPIHFYPVSVAGHDCGIVVPVRTSHGQGLVELVAPFNFRKTLGLSEGHEVAIEARR